MDLKLFITLVLSTLTNASIIKSDIKNDTVDPDNVFNGVYSECFLHLSYLCLQKKTLLYLKELNNLNEVSVIGEYVKFVKINKSNEETTDMKATGTDELALMIDQAIDHFFDNHVLKFYAMGRNITMPRNEEFVGRKKRKGGGGGSGGHGGGGHDDGGKKKMMMMAMMCMKMKLMMMVPAMMGMMGMMSFKGMMFSMMSFMLSKMMLLMKILEKKGGAGGVGGGGGLDGGWAAGGGGGGAWMPAGGQDYAGGGGYDANGQWQSRSIVENLRNYKTIDNFDIKHKDWKENNEKTRDWFKGKPLVIVPMESEWNSMEDKIDQTKPEISFVKRTVRYNDKIEKNEDNYKNPVLVYKRSNVHFDFNDPKNNIDQSYDTDRDTDKPNPRSKRDLIKRNKQDISDETYSKIQDEKYTNQASREYETVNELPIKSRNKRSIMDILQNSYIYWVNQILGFNNNRRTNPPRYKIVNGIKYVYYPYKIQKPKMPKELQMSVQNEMKPLAIEEFNKGEIVDGIESRMNKKKFNKMKDTVNDTVEENPWE